MSNPPPAPDAPAVMQAEPSPRTVFEVALGVPFFEGCGVDVLRNGDEIFPAMLAAIQDAATTIEFLTFVYWTGGVAEKFAVALADRAKAGIEVRVLLDAYGARPMKPTVVDMMTQAGVDVRWFRPFRASRFWEYNYRTHRKILVVDGIVGFTGGVGIAEEWEGNAANEGEWRDTHFRVRGSAVHGLRGAFLDNWPHASDEMDQLIRPSAFSPPAGSIPIQLHRASATIGKNDIFALNRVLLTIAEHRVRIATAYFLPDRHLVDRLIAAVRRGVVIEIMLPGKHADKRSSKLAASPDYGALLQAGVRLMTYETSMLHAKIMTVDGIYASVGSANFNMRSTQRDEEIAMLILDRQTVATLDRHFDEDMSGCTAIEYARWRRRGFARRMAEQAAQILRPHA